MRSVMIVVGHELAEDRKEVVLVEDDQVVQTFSAECPDNAFHDRVHVRLQLPAVAAMRDDSG